MTVFRVILHFNPNKKNIFSFLAFHSCVGGCNGCINLNQSANAGLAEALEPLEDKYLKLGLEEQGISRADFWAFAGMIAIEKGASLDIGSVKLPCLVVNNNRICNVAFMAEFEVEHIIQRHNKKDKVVVLLMYVNTGRWTDWCLDFLKRYPRNQYCNY